MELLGTLLIIGAIAVVMMIYFGMLGSDAMPFSCPRCHFGGDEDLAGRSRTWYVRSPGGARCRTCHTCFKEHPNGSLVEDRDP